MTATEQRHAALATALTRRSEIAAVRRDLRSGVLSLDRAMMNPPAALLRYPIIDVIRWTRATGKRGVSITTIGREAVRDNVNLMLPLGEASARTRAWAAEWGTRSWRPGS